MVSHRNNLPKRRTGMSKTDVKEVVEGFIDSVKYAFETGDTLEIRDFGVFSTVNQQPRKARNPRTGEEVIIPGRQWVSGTWMPKWRLPGMRH